MPPDSNNPTTPPTPIEPSPQKDIIPPWMQQLLLTAVKWLISALIMGCGYLLWDMYTNINELKLVVKEVSNKKGQDKAQWEAINKLRDEDKRLRELIHDGH